MDESRAEALQVIAAAKQDSARDAEATEVAAADEEIRRRPRRPRRGSACRDRAALAEIEGVAAEAAREMVAKLAGVNVSRDRRGRP